MSSKKVDVGFMKFVVDDETFNREVVEDASKPLHESAPPPVRAAGGRG